MCTIINNQLWVVKKSNNFFMTFFGVLCTIARAATECRLCLILFSILIILGLKFKKLIT